MRVSFKYPRKLGNKIFMPGEHQVDDAHHGHWFFQGLVASKDATILEGPAPVGIEPVLPVGDEVVEPVQPVEPAVVAETPDEVETPVQPVKVEPVKIIQPVKPVQAGKQQSKKGR